MRYIMLEFNPTDARLKIDRDQICQTLKNRMGTGGNNVPLVLGVEDEAADSVGVESESCNDNV